MLDAGCGEGYLSRRMARAGAWVEAVDYSTEMLRLANERTPSVMGITYHHGNLEKLEMFGDQSFDLIVSNMVIQDLAHYEQAIAEMLEKYPHFREDLNVSNFLIFKTKRQG
ncbi:Malonyl-[acyl-carrier protein] O-methyltransferase [Paenibacillus polymyxa E681]|nr:hypothetical protein PPE_04908 [Paenibacillus polymyxa E681]QNV59694.1 Malonyl-[acyl-carrier protein] O-methyltransferase [Paenibacillus polymyxa E681]QNV64520.1 Malonyl-[acyl-carrier protein] O-methyltransferase [Paenibacillus polymyxa E681]